MDAARWQRIDALFQAVVDLEPEARRALLEGEPETEIRQEVEEMLAAVDSATLATSEAPGGEELETIARPDALERIVQAGLVSVDDGGNEMPERVGPYRLVREIGRGGLATVYLAERDGEFSRRVAVKLIRRGLDTDDILDRMRRERQILARLDHPYIARMYEGGTAPDGRPYFVMEAIEGKRIDQWCDENAASLPRRLELFLKVCEAVEYAHSNLVLHRDIKPSNILVTEDGTPKLLDFGIAKVLGSGGDDDTELSAMPTLTRPGDRLLTPEYAAPEQIRGAALSTAADVYALGVLLYRLIAGRLPYTVDRNRLAELDRLVSEARVARPSTVIREAAGRGQAVPARWPKGSRAEDLDNVTLMALRKEPDRRYATVRRLVNDLRAYREDLPVSARKDTLRYRSAKFVRRHRSLVGTAVIVFSSLVGAVLVSGYQARVARQERETAIFERDSAEQTLALFESILSDADPNRHQGEEITVSEALDGAFDRLPDELDERPLLKARLMSGMGRIYRNLPRYDRAEEMFRGALDIYHPDREARPGPVITNLIELGQTAFDRGDLETGETVLREALALQRSEDLSFQDRSPQDLPSLIRNLGLLADVLTSRRAFDEAESFYAEALALPARSDAARRARATALNAYAEFWADRRPDKAEPLAREAWEMRRRLLGERHLDTLESYGNLAQAIGRNGDKNRAAEMNKRLIDYRIEILGPEDPRLIRNYLSLAVTLRDAHRGLEAFPYFDRALAIAAVHFGPAHKEALRIHRAAILTHRSLEQWREARELADRAWRLVRDAYGETHLETLKLQRLRGELMGLEGHPAAESQLRQVVQVAERTLRPDDAFISQSLGSLGFFLLSAGRPDEAEPLLRRALDIRAGQSSMSHWVSAKIQGELGRSLMRLGRFDDAEQELQEARATLLKLRGPDHNLTLKVESYLQELDAERAAR